MLLRQRVETFAHIVELRSFLQNRVYGHELRNFREPCRKRDRPLNRPRRIFTTQNPRSRLGKCLLTLDHREQGTTE
jgi:hypothetical protein